MYNDVRRSRCSLSDYMSVSMYQPLGMSTIEFNGPKPLRILGSKGLGSIYMYSQTYDWAKSITKQTLPFDGRHDASARSDKSGQGCDACRATVPENYSVLSYSVQDLIVYKISTRDIALM